MATALPSHESPTGMSSDDTSAVDKWSILRDLADGRAAFGLTDRTLTVLSALLSFHPGRTLSGGAVTVFPSNASLSGRLHGMPESTLRRHLAALIDAGMIARHDSPNGKRYATRDGQGQIDRIFGFDLRPLFLRVAEISGAAETARQDQRLVRRTRQSIALLLRDASTMLEFMADCDDQETSKSRERLDELRRLLRRKLGLKSLLELEAALQHLVVEIRPNDPKSQELSANDAQNERHQHNIDSDIPDSESVEERQRDEMPPLRLILKAAPEIESYAPEPVKDWRDLSRLADFIRPMMGITLETWQTARSNLGERKAAAALACILQRFSQIRNPGAYLRRLSTTNDFRVGPMVMALLRSHERAISGS